MTVMEHRRNVATTAFVEPIWAARDLEPHKIATYAYELAREMNRYYEKTPIAQEGVSEVEKAARLILLKKVSQVFTSALDLLGIEVPSQM